MAFFVAPALQNLFAGDRLELVLRPWANLRVAHNNSRAGIPPEYCFIIAWRTQILGAFVVVHGFPQSMVGCRGAVRASVAKIGVPISLRNNACIVGALVLA